MKQNSKSQADNNSPIELQKPIETTSSPTCTKPRVGGCGTLKPILFKTEMVQAILEGRKTQTRRILKVKGCKPFIPDYNFDLETILKWNKDYFPYGKVGDVLWVRETFMNTLHPNCYLYRATTNNNSTLLKWKPSLFMPFAACRLFLKVTNVRIERLQDITEIDAQCEGIRQVIDKLRNEKGFVVKSNYYETAKKAFNILWENINGSGSYSKNPFVWVIEFERCSKL